MIMHSADLFSHCANWQRHGNYCGLSLQTAVELFQHLSGLDCVLVCCILQCCLDIRLSGFHEAQDLLIIHFSGTGSDTLEIISLYDIVLQVDDSDVISKQIDRAVEEFFTFLEIARIQNVDRVKDDPQIPAALTLIRTSSSFGEGSGASSSLISFIECSTQAFIKFSDHYSPLKKLFSTTMSF